MQQVTTDVTESHHFHANPHVLYRLYDTLKITITRQQVNGIQVLTLQEYVNGHVQVGIGFTDADAFIIFKPTDRFSNNFKTIAANDTEKAISAVLLLIITSHPRFIHRHVGIQSDGIAKTGNIFPQNIIPDTISAASPDILGINKNSNLHYVTTFKK